MVLERVAREHRHDAAGDDDEDDDNEVNRNQVAAQRSLRQQARCAQVVGDVAQPKRRYQCQEQVVAAAAGEDQRYSDHHRQHRQEAELGEAGNRRGDATDADQPTDGPDGHHRDQQPAVRRLAVRPVLDRSEQEPGKDRRREAEDHLVAVPRDALEPWITRQGVVVGARPPRDQRSAIQTPEEEERAESLLQHGQLWFITHGESFHHQRLFAIDPGQSISGISLP